ncbi:hypothetical protein [Nocardia rhizosphaerihabitans]|uniref:Uncharacterized protein n=1 Tax=Nocardia rhizosphaerihabitans TaxID=1691570 RepID=A0ABQ2KX67_9NOCA|nr:hypothetical protein [Nocardia rhizosphaerihabitans]GGN94366.1 hypothetical protein GCM10011610_57240 [Nocardia rhizosphaerihabitans]
MSNLDERMGLAVEWLERNQFSDGAGGAGWGWVHDVPPNPQNTAEVVCALTAAGLSVPRADEVLRLVRRTMMVPAWAGEGEFTGSIDIAWRLRALQCLGVGFVDPDVRGCIDALIREQDTETGGYRMSGDTGPISITATATAMHALAPFIGSGEQIAQATVRGVGFLVQTMLSDDVRVEPVYAAAQVVTVLARPEYSSLGGRRARRASELAIERILEGIADDNDCNEEEPYQRGEVAHTWRHLSLHLAVGALLSADPDLIFHPTVRTALTEMFDLQEMAPQHAAHGGFRTSPKGFVTSYATKLAVESMTYVRAAIVETVNPGRIFDIICRFQGAHHTDGNAVAGWGKRRLVINSYAGLAAFAVCAVAAITVAVVVALFRTKIGDVAARALLVWSTGYFALGALAWLVSRFPTVSAARIAAGVFAGFTAVVLPIVTFMFP